MVRPSGESLKNLIRGAWDATRGARPAFFAFVTLFVAAYVFDLLTPWAIGYMLGVLVKSGFTPEGLNQAYLGLGAYVGLRLLNTVCHHLGRYIQLGVSFEGRLETLERIFGTILEFPINWHVGHHSGESLSKLHRSAGAIDVTLGTYVWQMVEGIVKVVFASVAIVTLDLWVATNVVVMSMVTILFMVMFNKKLIESIRANNSYVDRLHRIFIDYLYNIITIKSLNLEPQAQAYLARLRPDGKKLNKRIVSFSELKWGTVGIGYTFVLGTSLIIYINRHRTLAAPIDVAQVYVLINYLDRIFQAIGSFTAYYGGMLESATAYEDAVSVMEQSAQLPKSSSGSKALEKWNTIELIDTFFRYTKDGSEGLEFEKFTIRKGDKIALVGPSGGGKSTLLRILGGLIIPRRCKVVVDGSREISVAELAESVLIVPQEPEIFSETVRYNLTMGEDFSGKDLENFASLCRLEDVIAKLPLGWDSFLAESGGNLSVGEKQRIALARGLLRGQHRALILLDEPTSSLDPFTEKEIFFRLLQRFSERAIVTACHRLALVPLFDKIVFVRDGRIEEIGGFTELLEKRGGFYQAWRNYEEGVVKRITPLEGEIVPPVQEIRTR